MYLFIDFLWNASGIHIGRALKLLTIFHHFEYPANVTGNVLKRLEKSLHVSSHDTLTIIIRTSFVKTKEKLLFALCRDGSVWSKEFLDIQVITEYRFILKCELDMIMIYNQICINLNFEAYDKVIYEITNHLQKPDFVIHKNIQEVFVKIHVIKVIMTTRSVKFLTCTRSISNEKRQLQ